MEVKTRFVLQAYLEASPGHPMWSEIQFSAINDHEKYRWWNKGDHMHDPRMKPKGDNWEFTSFAAGLSVLRELKAVPQDYYLRLVRIVITKDVAVLAGTDLEDGTLVDGPGDKKASIREKFWKASPKVIRSILPAEKVKELPL